MRTKRFLIEHQHETQGYWYPVRTNGQFAVWHQFADADRAFKGALSFGPDYRLIETDETDEQLEARRL